MTPDEINRAIAEACGRKGQALYPDYCHDLNAMHEAESELTLDEKDAFAARLTEMFHGPGWSFVLIHATAAQRAEAFLRTIERWEEKT